MHELERILSHYGVEGKVVGTTEGPLIKQIKFEPKVGTKMKNITSSLEDIAREMGVKSLRVSNVCENNCIGFEIPNDTFKTVPLLEILESEAFQSAPGELPINLGVRIDGTPMFADLAKMPHLLVAGATGSGKSVGLNSFIISLIKHKKSSELKFVMIDPKRIEFSVYNDQRYMFMPVITDNAEASAALDLLILEMNKRYELFEKSLTKNIKEYNQKEGGMAYIVTIVDEFSDLVLSDKSVEKKIQILAQKARAAGIHLILATQRPSVDVVTGSIKANFPSRLAFKTASFVDSKTILDTTGAEDLVGRGDALFLAGTGELSRIHGAYISTEEIDEVLKPYRAKVQKIRLSPSSSEKDEEQTDEPKENKKTKKRFFLVAWFVLLWNWLGKVWQRRIIKAILAAMLGQDRSIISDTLASELTGKKTRRKTTRRR